MWNRFVIFDGHKTFNEIRICVSASWPIIQRRETCHKKSSKLQVPVYESVGRSMTGVTAEWKKQNTETSNTLQSDTEVNVEYDESRTFRVPFESCESNPDITGGAHNRFIKSIYWVHMSLFAVETAFTGSPEHVQRSCKKCAWCGENRKSKYVKKLERILRNWSLTAIRCGIGTWTECT